MYEKHSILPFVEVLGSFKHVLMVGIIFHHDKNEKQREQNLAMSLLQLDACFNSFLEDCSCCTQGLIEKPYFFMFRILKLCLYIKVFLLEVGCLVRSFSKNCGRKLQKFDALGPFHGVSQSKIETSPNQNLLPPKDVPY